MELTDLSCEICSLPLASCTCPDIDERIYNYDVMMEALRKQNPNRLDERMTRLLSISHFVAPEVQGVELITDTLQPWTGYRDKAFSKEKKSGIRPFTGPEFQKGGEEITPETFVDVYKSDPPKARFEGEPNVDTGSEPGDAKTPDV